MLEETAKEWFVVLSFGAYPTDTIDDAVDKLMDALMDSDRITDPDITASEANGTIEVAVYVTAISPAKAVACAISTVSEAIHRSGGLADEWDNATDDALNEGQFETTVRPANLVDA